MVDFYSKNNSADKGSADETLPSPFRMQDTLQSMHEKMPMRYREELEDAPPKRRGAGCLSKILNCRCIFLFLFLFTLAVIAILIWIFATRPTFIYEPLKNWLNDGLQATETSAPTVSLDDLGDQVTAFQIGDNDLVITEAELRSLLTQRLSVNGLNNLQVSLQPGVAKLYWDADTHPDSSTEPLWMVLEVTSDDAGQLTLQKFGTQRIGVPAFLNQIVQRIVLSVVSLAGSKDGGFVGLIVPLPSNIHLKGVEIEQGKLRITLNVGTGLENSFPSKK